MAYFSNGSEGAVFDDQCARCKYGDKPCPIAAVQMEYNYDQHKDKTGTTIKLLNDLVKDDGTCNMYETFKDDLAIDPNQMTLFNS
jgi:formate hydrogenlyase subunit 6/NADH:ubiquinone oxidoreductase subunit I